MSLSNKQYIDSLLDELEGLHIHELRLHSDMEITRGKIDNLIDSTLDKLGVPKETSLFCRDPFYGILVDYDSGTITYGELIGLINSKVKEFSNE